VLLDLLHNVLKQILVVSTNVALPILDQNLLHSSKLLRLLEPSRSRRLLRRSLRLQLVSGIASAPAKQIIPMVVVGSSNHFLNSYLLVLLNSIIMTFLV
jgi:hypothetical protein